MSTTHYTYRRMARKKRAVPVSAGKQASSPFFDFGGEHSFFSGKLQQGTVNDDSQVCGEQGKSLQAENPPADRIKRDNVFFDKAVYEESEGPESLLATERNNKAMPNPAGPNEQSGSRKDGIAMEKAALGNLDNEGKEPSTVSDTLIPLQEGEAPTMARQ